MATLKSIIRPAAGGDGPFMVVTEVMGDPIVKNTTLTVANLNAALDQAKSDQAALLGGLTVESVNITTKAS